ncbi:MAG TPA: hypothetical protein PLD93_01890 [Synergistaceae bacterium]|nr:hypothetical protein [Synergistaceae bacterium]
MRWPTTWCGNAGEGFRLGLVFAVVEDARRDDEQQPHHGGGEDEFFFVRVQHVLDEAERCEVAPRLGDPQDAEEAQHAHGAKVDAPEGEVEGKDCEQVDDGHGAQRKADASPDGAGVAGVDGAGPQSGDVLPGEDDDRDEFEQVERPSPPVVDLVDGADDDGDHVDDDERKNKDVEHPADGIARLGDFDYFPDPLFDVHCDPLLSRSAPKIQHLRERSQGEFFLAPSS